MRFSPKLMLSLLALACMSGAVALSTQLRFELKATSPTSSMEELLEWEAETLLSNPHYEQQFIRTGPPEWLYNCHGWTFTGGKRSVTDDEVKRILRHGRYRKVTEPEAGDVVIYYDAHGTLCHSGIVKATGKKGFVLVESKWGGAGRFLHVLELPQVQTSYAFYRRGKISPRVHHFSE
jgi:hypothetical protein